MKSFCRHSRYLLAASFQPISKAYYVDNMPHAPFLCKGDVHCKPSAFPKTDSESKLRNQSAALGLTGLTETSQGWKGQQRSPEAGRGSVGSVGSAVFPCSPRSPRPAASPANSVGVNKREAGSREQTISTTCSLPEPVAVVVPENKNNIKKSLISVVLELIPAAEPVEGK